MLWSSPQGICRALVLHHTTVQFCWLIFADHLHLVLANLCRFLLPLFPPSWYACFLVSIRSGKLFPLISFSVTIPAASGHFLGWFLFSGLPWIPPFSLWLPANSLRTSSQAYLHVFVTSLILMLPKLFV